MTEDQFEKTEAEYFRLKGQLAAGRMSQQQFDAALKRLVFQDVQGRYWMLGADSGKWYVHDGQTWVMAHPQPSTSSAAAPFAAPIAQTESRGSRKRPFLATGCIGFLCLVGIVGLIGASVPRLLSIDLGATSRPTPLPRIGSILLSPTLGFPMTTAPTPTSFLVRTATNTPVPPTPTPTGAPGVYVMNLRLEPPSPKRREEIGFYPTFLNTTGSEQSYRWLVYIYRTDNLGHAFGETPKSTVPFPIGAVEQRANGTWKLTGGGECENFIARLAWINQDNQPIPFTKSDGQAYELPFTVCP